MSEMTIITNNVPRDIIYGHELTAEERAEFDYIDWAGVERGEGDLGAFVRYKGQLYDLHDMEQSNVPGWDGQVTDSFFSGVLFRFPRENDHTNFERVVCGRCYA